MPYAMVHAGLHLYCTQLANGYFTRLSNRIDPRVSIQKQVLNAFVNSKGSDQPAHPRSLVRAFVVNSHHESCSKTAWTQRLIDLAVSYLFSMTRHGHLHYLFGKIASTHWSESSMSTVMYPTLCSSIHIYSALRRGFPLSTVDNWTLHREILLIHMQDFHIFTMSSWLVGCFEFNGPLRQYFSLYRAVSQREGERREKW